jgi:hypothetical protein
MQQSSAIDIKYLSALSSGFSLNILSFDDAFP